MIDDVAAAPAHRAFTADWFRRALPLAVKRLPVFWPFLLWTAILVASRRFYPWNTALPAAIRGLLILFSFIAWGATLVRALTGERGCGWGLNGSLGMALTLAVFGVIALLRLVSLPTIVTWTALGPFVFCFQRAWYGATARGDFAELDRRLRSILRRPQLLMFLLGLVVLYIVAALDYSNAVMNAVFNKWDDEMAYRGFARQFLDRGTLLEPFSFRRAATYGGQSLLQAFVLALADADRLHIFDNGIALLLIFGLIVGYRAVPSRAARPAVLVAGFMLLTLFYVPHNLGSALSGVLAMFLALFRLFDEPRFADAPRAANAILVGLVTAAACTLRQNYISAAVGFVAFMYLALILFLDPQRGREWAKRGAATALATVGFLLPWLVLAVVAIGTPLYPIIAGNVRPDFGFVGSLFFDHEVRWALTNLLLFKPMAAIGLLFAAAVLLPGRRQNRPLHAFLLANIVAFCLMVHFFQNFQDFESVARYYLGFTLAFAFAVTLVALSQASMRHRSGVLPAAALVMFAAGYQLISSRDQILGTLQTGVTSFNNVFWQRGSKPHDQQALYQRIQGSVPAGASVLVMLDHTYLLDGKRNVLFTFDHPCAAGPKPRPPCFEGAEAMAAYLKRQGIRYIAYQLGPSSPEYSINYWEKKLPATNPPKGRITYYERQAIFELDFFSTLVALTKSRRSVFAEGEVRVLDLDAPWVAERAVVPAPTPRGGTR